MEDWQSRVLAERDALADKRNALKLFMADTGPFVHLDQADRLLLRQQFQVMTNYLDILHSRISKFRPVG